MTTDLNPSTPRARVLGAGVIAFPLMLLAIDALTLVRGETDTTAGGAILVWSSVALGLGYSGIVGLVQHRLPRFSAVLSVLCAAHVAGTAAFGVDMVYVALGSVALVDSGNAAGFLATGAPGIMAPFALAGCGIALLLARAGSRWAGIALIVGGILFPISRIPDIVALGVLDDLILLSAAVPIGLLVARGHAPLARPASALQPAAG